MTDVVSVQPSLSGQARHLRTGPGGGGERTARPRALVARRALVFAIAAALPFYLAVRNGGYDLVVRQEVGLVLWIGIAIAVAAGVLPRGHLGRPQVLPLVAILGLGALSTLSLNWTGSSEHTLAEVARIATYAGIVFLAILGLNRYTWRSAAAGLGAAALGVCLLALASRLAPSHFSNSVSLFFATDRLSYPLNYWNAVGAWGAITLAMGLSWSANSSRFTMRCAGLASAPVAGLTVYLTYSRGGVASAAAAIVACLALSRNRWTAAVHCLAALLATGALILLVRSKPEIAHATGSAGGGAVLLALVCASAACAGVAAITQMARIDAVRLPSPLARRVVPVVLVASALAIAVGGHGVISRGWDQFVNQRTAADSSNPTERLTTTGGTRHDVWSAALDDFNAHPWGGSGPGTFEFWWARHGKGHEFVRDAHSLYLEELAELGLPGFLILVCFLGSLLALALRARARAQRSSDVAATTAMCAAGIVFLIQAGVDWLWEETAVGVLGIGALAVAASALIQRRKGRLSWTRSRASILAVGMASALVLVPGMVSSSREGQSEAALRAGQTAEAGTLADDAVGAAPWAASPYEQRAAVEDRQGRLSAARDDLREAIKNEPADWRQLLQLSQVELELGDDSAARADFRRANDFNRVYRPYGSFEEFRRAATPGCLVLGPLVCGNTGALVSSASCLAAPPPLIAALASGLSQFAVVRSLARPEIYYVAAATGSGPALWVADRVSYTSGQGTVVPLNEAARSASPAGTGLNPASYAVSATDTDALAALACLER